jgi:hypothetical protein
VVTAVVLIAVALNTLLNRSLLDPLAVARRAQAQAIGNTLPIAGQTPACCAANSKSEIADTHDDSGH